LAKIEPFGNLDLLQMAPPPNGGLISSEKNISKLPSGKRLHNYGKSPCLMGKSTISMAIFNSYVSLPEGILTISWQSVAKCCFEMNMMNVAHQNW
jgi:hypothetical protein